MSWREFQVLLTGLLTSETALARVMAERAKTPRAAVTEAEIDAVLDDIEDIYVAD